MSKSDRDKVIEGYVFDSEWSELRRRDKRGEGKYYRQHILSQGRRRADSDMYVQYQRCLMANFDKKDLIAKDMQEKFGFSSPTYVSNIIKQYDENPDLLAVKLRNVVDVIRSVGIPKAYESHLKTVAEIDRQLADLYTLKENGDKWYEIGGKDWSDDRSSGVEVKKIKIEGRILELNKERDRVYGEWYKLVGEIAPPEKHLLVSGDFVFAPDQALADMYARNDKQMIETDVEIVN